MSSEIEGLSSTNDIKACCLIFFGTLSWTLSFLYSNQNNFGFFQTMLVWGLGNFVFSTVGISRYQKQGYVITDVNQIKKCTFRNICLILNGSVIALVQFYLPLPIVHLVDNSGPFFVFAIDYLKNGIQVNRKQGYSLIVGAIGLILVVNGRFIETLWSPQYKFTSLFQNYHSLSLIVFVMMVVFQVFSMFVWAYGIVLTKQLKSTPLQIAFNHSATTLIIMGITYQTRIAQTLPITWPKYIISIVLTGFLLANTSFCYINGLKLTSKAGMVTAVGFTSVPISYMISFIRYQQSINFICLVGGLMILVGIFSLVRAS